MFAFLYKAKGGGWELFVCPRVDVLTYDEIVRVSGKREARQVAKARHLICWNF